METLVTRNFRVKGVIRNLFTNSGSIEVTKYFSGLRVELWQKGPLDVTFLGGTLTESDGIFVIGFQKQSPTSLIEDGKIKDVFFKIYYKEKPITGVLGSGGSFD